MLSTRLLKCLVVIGKISDVLEITLTVKVIDGLHVSCNQFTSVTATTGLRQFVML